MNYSSSARQLVVLVVLVVKANKEKPHWAQALGTGQAYSDLDQAITFWPGVSEVPAVVPPQKASLRRLSLGPWADH